jgi:chemotaxis signal transduction protein
MRTTPLRRFGREPATVATDPYLIFTVLGLTYATPLSGVREVTDLVRLTPVPDVPEMLLGTQVLRGHRIPVVDLSAVLEGRRLRLTRTSCTLLVPNLPVVDEPAGNLPMGDGDALTGFAVDGVIGVKGLAASALVAAPRLGETSGPDVVVALISTSEGLLPLLDPARILASAEVRRAVAAWGAPGAPGAGGCPKETGGGAQQTQ